MKLIGKNKTITHFSSSMNPNYHVELGEKVLIETHDCYGGQITSEKVLRPTINLDTMNQATGPVYVNNLRKNDTLCLEINNIELDETGIMVTSKGLGLLGDKITKPTTRLFQVKNDKLFFNKDLIIPVKPMIGVIGVAPSNDEVHCAIPGNHGGNLDTKDITIGNKIYLPVFQDGGLFALGDMHAAMGDGEMNGTGVEIGGKTTLTVSKLENRKIDSPIVENSDSFLFIYSAETLNLAIKKCAEKVVNHLQRELTLQFEDAYRVLSAVCDIKISQIVNKLVTVRISVPKSVLPTLFVLSRQ
ncbi:acetamidase/formamidase family protein [Virgibacillus oceani]|uniref:Acetamidase n=1 Tax=Virgibacillus oceani TaxID=1479511 RepID=A0A917HIU4_9BACI|nr:acetamidase/formamidase family protein [Virgibacillus oceani]GGG79909.1 acetamidase [Virgibacillus oceani]